MRQTNNAIAGTGRIGRPLFWEMIRRSIDGDPVKVVAVSDWDKNYEKLDMEKRAKRLVDKLTQPDDLTSQVPPFNVELRDHQIIIDGDKKNPVAIYTEEHPSKVPWGSFGDLTVHDATGVFKSREKARLFLEGGASRVLNAAPMDWTEPEEPIPHYIHSINSDLFVPLNDRIASYTSCTTKNLAYFVQTILDEGWEISEGSFFGVHAATSSQGILKTMNNAIVASSGASKSLARAIPRLEGKVSGYVIRVPTTNGSYSKLTLMVNTDHWLSPEEVEQAVVSGSERYPDELSFTHLENPDLVNIRSKEYEGFSTVVVMPRLKVSEAGILDGRKQTKIEALLMYNNEHAPACSQARFAVEIAPKILGGYK